MINFNELTAVCQQNGAEIELDVPLAGYTSFKIGGPCKAMVTLNDAERAGAIFAYLRDNEIKHRLIGRGSNLLVTDKGYDGIVLRLGGEQIKQLSLHEDGVGIRCSAGTSLQRLCQFALDHSLTGLEFAYGIPGSVGGAVYMNAGAYDGEIAQVLSSVTVWQPDGQLHKMKSAELDLRYRHSIFMQHPDWYILDAHFVLDEGYMDAIRDKMQDLLSRRKDKQPLEYPSAGSTFKRPAASDPAHPVYASKLIDECGLKGFTVGGAQVSEKHAGFVINRGGATFSDVMAVCEYVRETVRMKTDIEMEMEPEILR